MPRPPKEKPAKTLLDDTGKKKLKSGVEVYYPPSLYKSKPKEEESPKPDEKPTASAHTEVKPAKTRAPIVFRHDDPSPTTPPKKAPSKSPVDKASKSTTKLASGVSVWYPEALYPKTASQQTVKPLTSTYYNLPFRLQRLGWTIMTNKNTNVKFFYNSKTGESSYERPEAFAQPEVKDDESDDEQQPAKKTVTKGPRARITAPTATSSGTLVGSQKVSRKIIVKKRPTAVSKGVTRTVSEDDEDVEMMDITVEADVQDAAEMDVDPVETVKNLRNQNTYVTDVAPSFFMPETPVGNSSATQPVFSLVFDTNVFLHRQVGEFLVSFALNELKALPLIQIRIPHIVLLELDKLKMRTGHPIALSAVQAIRFLNDCIMDRKDSRFIGQTGQEHSRGIPDFTPSMNDDHILVYYLQIQAKHIPNNHVYCVTNDINLQTRATVNGMSAISAAKLLQEVNKRMRGEASMFDVQTAGFRIPSISLAETAVNVGNGKPALSYDTCLLVEKCVTKILLRILSALVETRMRQLYDDHWLDVVKTKPPWLTIQSVVDVMQKHWIAAFGDIFSSDDKTLLSSLSAVASKSAVTISHSDDLLLFGVKTISAVGRLPLDIRGPFDHMLSAGLVFTERWRDMFDRARKGLQPVDLLVKDCSEFLQNNA